MKIEDRGGVKVLVYDVGCRPATDAEVFFAARLAEAERERDEWHARAIALFWKGDADGATCGHIRAATATIKQLLAADSADAAQTDCQKRGVSKCTDWPYCPCKTETAEGGQ